MTTAYAIKGLDCAVCGAKIENTLKGLPGVQDATVDFANMRLFLDAADPAKALIEIAKVEPSVQILPVESLRGSADEKTFVPVRELLYLSSALIVFFIHLALEDRFHANGWAALDYGLALTAYFLAGTNIYINAFRTIRRGDFFDENVLMVIATAGAIAIHALSEAVGVMLFFKAGEFLQNMAVGRSRRSVQALLAARPDRANVISGQGIRQVPPELVKVGETALIRPGEKVPLDGEVVNGHSTLDTSPLTGEPVPIEAKPGTSILAGMINLSGSLRVRVSKPFSESSIAKVLALVETATTRKAKTEKFITTFARWYTPTVVGVSLTIALLPPLLVAGESFADWVYRALVVLVVSCPCALVVSIPMGYFGGIGRASRQGILVKGSNFLDALAKIRTVVFDKTGTLTRGNFEVKAIVSHNGWNETGILKMAALAEMDSNHPIGKSIVQKAAEVGIALDRAKVSEHLDLPGRGIQAKVEGHDVLVGSDGLLHQERIAPEVCELQGNAVHVVIGGEYAGYLLIGDTIKPDAKAALSALRKIGVERVEMLTGDNRRTAEAVGKELVVDAVHSELLPEDKVSLLEKILSRSNHGGKVAFVGDGINDAPVIARADVGIAMGALGSDAAIETADVVLMTDSPMKVAEAIRIARKTKAIVWQNIILALGVKVIFVALGTMGMASMWEAVFADMGVSLAAVVNSTRVLQGKG
jgi:Zn2+/Cd2+-exporting ATPase